MVNHEYWIDIYPTSKLNIPWRVEVTETRTYKTIENVEFRTPEEVIEKVKSYWRRYGKNQARLAEHVYYIAPNKSFEKLAIEYEDEVANDESGRND
ncbi:MAG: hypothetical protein IJH65_03560 [Methanobrevibacter sp.]|nr:hypothetical protein [Methanobrevibacter sp.]